MTSLLFIISFLLHLILLGVVYYLHQQIQELKAERSRETEVLLSRFLDEIKQENRQLQHQLQQQSQEKDQTVLSNYLPKEKSEETTNTPSGYSNTKDLAPDLPPMTGTEKIDKLETSTESRIFQLYQEGIPMEEIAKQVKRGKTEVELLIKLQQPK